MFYLNAGSIFDVTTRRIQLCDAFDDNFRTFYFILFFSFFVSLNSGKENTKSANDKIERLFNFSISVRLSCFDILVLDEKEEKYAS